MQRILPPFLHKPATLSLLVLLVLVTAFVPASSVRQAAGIQPLVKVRPARVATSPTQPPTDAQCRTAIGLTCYSPQEIWNGYGIGQLIAQGDSGVGQTIVIFDAYGSPTLQSDLATFDAGFNLPPPPALITLAPIGLIPPFDPSNSTQVGWAEETSLDVQWAHAIAPNAKIILMESPVAETEGIPGMPQMYALENIALKNHLGQVWSQSWGTTENDLFSLDGDTVLNEFNAQYQAAGQQGISVFASTGDSGVANYEPDGSTFFSFPTVLFPASSPWVTAAGGTNLFLTTSGVRVNETTWNDGFGAGGGGVSQYFTEPSYQAGLPSSDQAILNGWRGLPDVAYNAGVLTGVSVYLGFTGSGVTPGWYIFGGTSAASPQWAGVTADLNQAVGHPLGFLNPMLYQVGEGSTYSSHFYDITSGNNSFNGLTGYNATTGWDPATGWGSPNENVISGLVRLASR
jgi:subtilase family serine protease